MKWKFSYVFILWFFFVIGEEPIWQSKRDDGFSLKIYAPLETATLGFPFTVALEVQYPEGYKIDLNSLRENLTRQLRPGSVPFQVDEALDQNENNPSPLNKKITFWLEPKATGRQFFSFWDINFKPIDPQKEKIIMASPQFQLNIEPIPSEFNVEPMIAPFLIKRDHFPVEISPENKRAFLVNPFLEKEEALRNVRLLENKKFPWIPLIAFLAAGSLLFTGRNRKKTANPKIRNIKQDALHRIKKLEVFKSEPNAELFYTGLVKTTRAFIEEYYHVPVDSQTTEEFLNNISKNKLFHTETESILTAFLAYADKIRFGKQKATDEERRKALDLIVEFIEKS